MIKRLAALCACCLLCFSAVLTACSKDPETPAVGNGWTLQNVSLGEDGVYRASGENAVLKTDGSAPAGSVLSFDVRLTGDGEVFFAAQSERDGYSVSYDATAKSLTLNELSGGERTVLGTKSASMRAESWYTFKIEAAEGRAAVYLNDDLSAAPLWAKFELAAGRKGREYLIDMRNAEVKNLKLQEYAPPAAAEAESVYVNPVDYAAAPSVIYYKGVYWMYAESETGRGIDVYRSYDLIEWNNNGPVFGEGALADPSAAVCGGKIYLSYIENGTVKLAASAAPDAGFAQAAAFGGAERASLYAEGDALYLLSAAGGVLTGAAVNMNESYALGQAETLLTGTRGDAALCKQGGHYYLFYTASAGETEQIGVAQADKVLAAYGSAAILVGAGERSEGAASPSVVLSPDGKEPMLVYAQKATGGVCVDRLAFDGQKVSTTAPSHTKQAVPSGVTRIMLTGDMGADERTRKNDLMFANDLAARNVSGSLNFDNNYFPVWNADVTKNGTAKFMDNWHGHNIGRWMDAMYRWQALTGNEIDPFLKNVMLNNTKWFFSNEDSVCFQPVVEGIGKFFDLHSLREGMAALNAIIEYETGEWQAWAIETAHKMVQTVDEKLKGGESSGSLVWNKTAFGYYEPGMADLNNYYDSCGSNGRFTESLMRYYKLTKNLLGEPDEDAFALAGRIVNYNYTYSIRDDGGINYASGPNHTHSYQNMLQGMLQYGQELRDRGITDETGRSGQDYIDRVALSYGVTIMRLVTPSGVVTHDLESGAQGWETSSTTDALQLAMWLVEEGYTEFADVPERLLRARLLPAQFVEGDTLSYTETGAAATWNMKDRVNGGYSMIFDSPYSGKFCTTDVTCHVMQGLIDAYKRTVYESEGASYVMMHFDYETEGLSMVSERGERGTLRIEVKSDRDVYLRLPLFKVASRAEKDPAAHEISVNGKAADYTLTEDGYFAHLVGLKAGDTVVLTYDLPEETTQETHTNGVTYTIRWKGDEIVKVTPASTFYPMFR